MRRVGEEQAEGGRVDKHLDDVRAAVDPRARAVDRAEVALADHAHVSEVGVELEQRRADRLSGTRRGRAARGGAAGGGGGRRRTPCARGPNGGAPRAGEYDIAVSANSLLDRAAAGGGSNSVV